MKILILSMSCFHVSIQFSSAETVRFSLAAGLLLALAPPGPASPGEAAMQKILEDPGMTKLSKQPSQNIEKHIHVDIKQLAGPFN